MKKCTKSEVEKKALANKRAKEWYNKNKRKPKKIHPPIGTEKKCGKCNKVKKLSNFSKCSANWDKKKTTCKSCDKIAKDKWNNENKDYIKAYDKKRRLDPKVKLREEKYRKEYYAKNKDDVLRKNKEKYFKNHEKNKAISLQYFYDNKERLLAQNRAYKLTDEYRLKRNKKDRLRKKTDMAFALRSRLTSRIRAAFKATYWIRKSSNKKLLGCSYDIAVKHLERQFTRGMNWNNMGEWHIDHQIPLASAKTEEELIKLCHYTNLQPLWAFDNMSKGAKIPNVQIPLRL